MDRSVRIIKELCSYDIEWLDLVYLLDEVSNQYHKEISSDVINKYQFKKVDDIVNFILEG